MSLSHVSGLLLRGPGQAEIEPFFDELIPALDKAAGRYVHIHALGEPSIRGENYERHVVEGLLSTSVKDLSKNWDLKCQQHGAPHVAQAAETDAAMHKYGLTYTDLPCIVFDLTGVGLQQPVVLHIPEQLLGSHAGRSSVASTLLAELSSDRFKAVVAKAKSRRAIAVARAWAEHIMAVDDGLRTKCLHTDPTPTRQPREERKLRLSATEQRIFEMLECGPADGPTLAAKLGVPNDPNLRETLSALRRHGLIDNGPSGYFLLDV